LKKAFNFKTAEAALITSDYLKRFYAAQFKRTVAPEGPKIFSISLSARGSLRLPSEIQRSLDE
jgi:NAD+ synthase (glutamine-hydrolysing)